MKRSASLALLLGFAITPFLGITPVRSQSASIDKLPPTVDLPDVSELQPVVTADGKSLYFARPRIGLDGDVVVDIWKSDIAQDTMFSLAAPISGRLGSRFGVVLASVAPDNNTVYVSGKFDEDTPPDQRIFVSHRVKDGWSQPEPIRIRNLNAKGLYTDYSFGTDQKTLVMSVNRDSSAGGRDLYVSFLDEQRNEWSTPLWLGADVNSSWDEMTPFLAADNRTLYFASTRPGGYGDLDIYRVRRLDDSWQKWTRPENLGNQVNRSGRTSFYTEDAKGEYAYFVWRPDDQAQTDIYRTKVAKSLPIALVRGHVTDENGKPLMARIRYERLSDGKEMGTARSNPETGQFQLTLPAGEDYTVHAELENYLPTSEHFDLRTLKTFESIEKDLRLTEVRRGATVRLNSIFFETGKATLLSSSDPELERLKTFLVSNPEARISIEGHTDSIGSHAANMTLSQDRAAAVRSYLVKQGIDQARMEVQAFASDRPIATNQTEEGRAQNRRVEFRLLNDIKATHAASPQ